MLRRQLAGLTVATLTVLTLFFAFSPGIAGPQDKAKGQSRNNETIKEQAKAAPAPPADDAEKRAAQIAKMVAEYDLKPHPLAVDSRRPAASRRSHDQSSPYR